MQRICYGLFALLFVPTGPMQAAQMYSLPDDGAECEFTEEFQMSDLKHVGYDAQISPEPLPNHISVKATISLRSVGKEVRDGEPCRWIELKVVAKPSGELDPSGRILILKLLIPEAQFGDGRYPFASVRKAYYYSSDWKESIDASRAQRVDQDPRRLQYELDRFLPHFPALPEGVQPIERESVKLPMGNADCRRFEFSSSYEGKLSGGQSGKWAWSGKHRVWSSDDSPFGILAVHFEGDNSELDDEGRGQSFATRSKLQLLRKGKGAVSDLPDCQ